MRQNFRKEQTNRPIFSDKNILEFNRIYNVQRVRMWSVNHIEADKKGGVLKKTEVHWKSYDLFRGMFQRHISISYFG